MQNVKWFRWWIAKIGIKTLYSGGTVFRLASPPEIFNFFYSFSRKFKSKPGKI